MPVVELFEEACLATMRRSGADFPAAVRMVRDEHPQLWAAFIQSHNAREILKAASVILEELTTDE